MTAKLTLWVWPAEPLADGSPRNRQLPAGWGKPGDFIRLDDQTYYVPTEGDIEALAGYSVDPKRPYWGVLGCPDWLAVMRDLIRRGERLAELKELSAPELVGLLVPIEGDGRQVPDAAISAKALGLLVQHPDWTKLRVAREAGCNPSTLHRAIARLSERTAVGIPRGSKDKEGNVEAIDDAQ